MIFRKPPRRRPDAFRNESRTMRLVRYALILALLGATVWGLWENNNRRMVGVTAGAGGRPSAARLSEAESAKVVEYAERFQREYGVPIIIEVRVDAPAQNVLDALAGVAAKGDEPTRVVLVLCPPAERVFFLAPAAVQKALGEDAQALAGPLFVPYFASGDWRSGLKEALHRMAVRLDADFVRRR
jgi:hypothetical protein